jgi:hypothetical protein
MTASTLAFTPGDVLRTEPRPGYWGCAVILSAARKTTEFHPRFHVGVTPAVFRHEFDFSEIDASQLTILRFSRDVRTEPDTYVARGTETCIGIYTAKSRGDLLVLGKVDPLSVYAPPLTLEVGDGTNGSFPLCGPLRKNIGVEAVISWRRIHDAETLSREVIDARESFEAMEAERLAKQRERSKRKRGNA